MKLIRTQPAERLRQIYTEAFPPEERREWAAMPPADPAFAMYSIVCDSGLTAGLLTAWHMPDFTYIEHLAIAPELRGGGIGSKVLQALPGTLLLEVEPAETSRQASERISFYNRNNFAMLDVDYIQPPYGPGLPALPLRLMVRGKIDDISAAIKLLHKRVYGIADNADTPVTELH